MLSDGEAYSEIPADHSGQDTNVRAQDVKRSPIYVNTAGIVGEELNQVTFNITTHALITGGSQVKCDDMPWVIYCRIMWNTINYVSLYKAVTFCVTYLLL